MERLSNSSLIKESTLFVLNTNKIITTLLTVLSWNLKFNKKKRKEPASTTKDKRLLDELVTGINQLIDSELSFRNAIKSLQ